MTDVNREFLDHLILTDVDRGHCVKEWVSKPPCVVPGCTQATEYEAPAILCAEHWTDWWDHGETTHFIDVEKGWV
jgi:hypothetical protein